MRHQKQHPRHTRRDARPIQQRYQPAPKGELKTPVSGAFQELTSDLQHAISNEGYTTPTPIQEQTIRPLLEGRDLLGCAQTGTGKTAAFSLPILQNLAAKPTPEGTKRPIRALLLSPTRELANQITESIKTYGKHVNLFHTAVYGGVNQHPQVQQLKRGVDILVATPGRLMDLMEQGYVDLTSVEMFVLDEADRMMDMGFINDIRKIMKTMPTKRQNMMFSATMPRPIQELAQTILKNPVEVKIAPNKPTVDTVTQSLFHVDTQNKLNLLKHMLNEEAVQRVIVFVRTRRRVDNVEAQLKKAGILVDIIHSGRSQRQRDRTIGKFRDGKTRALVATDVVSRGIDVDDVTHVINYDLPEEAETYVHRIGRTGRAGASGIAFSFCDNAEWKLLRDIERHLQKPVPVENDHPFPVKHQQRPRTRTGGRDGYESSNKGRGGNNFYSQKRRNQGNRKTGGRGRIEPKRQPAMS